MTSLRNHSRHCDGGLGDASNLQQSNQKHLLSRPKSTLSCPRMRQLAISCSEYVRWVKQSCRAHWGCTMIFLRASVGQNLHKEGFDSLQCRCVALCCNSPSNCCLQTVPVLFYQGCNVGCLSQFLRRDLSNPMRLRPLSWCDIDSCKSIVPYQTSKFQWISLRKQCRCMCESNTSFKPCKHWHSSLKSGQSICEPCSASKTSCVSKNHGLFLTGAYVRNMNCFSAWIYFSLILVRLV